MSPLDQVDAPQIIATGTRVVHKDPFTEVRVDDVIFPDGRAGSYTTVTPGTGMGAVVIARARSRLGAYYGLFRQFRYPLGEDTLEFPRGGTRDLEADEAARELAEELGVDPATPVFKIGELRPDAGLLTSRVGVWVATLPQVPRDHIEAETGGRSTWVSEGELIGLIRDGAICDGITLGAFGMLEASGHRVLPY